MKTSVIIRLQNNEPYIGFAIQSCIDFLENPQFIIVNNGCTDEGIGIVKDFCFEDITWIDIDNYTPGKALNLGMQQASSGKALVLSAHAQISNLDEVGIDYYLNRHVAVMGKQIPIYRGKRITPRYVWSHFIDEQEINMYSEQEGRFFLHNAACFYNVEFTIKHPFDEMLVSKEDRYWAKDIVRTNTYLYEPAFEVNHFYTNKGATWKGIG